MTIRRFLPRPHRFGADIFSVWGVASLVCITVLCGGCATMAAKNQASQVIEDGFHFVNLVGIASSRNSVIIHSRGQVRGSPLKKASGRNVSRVDLDAPWGKLTLLVPTDPNEMEKQKYFLESLESAFSANAVDSIGEVISKLDRVKEHQVRLRILFASEESGYYIVDKSSSLEDELSLSFVALVSPPSRGLGVRAPWIHVVRVVAHELLHVEHSLRGKVDITKSPNGEAAATVMAWCAHSDYLVRMGILDDNEEISLGEKETVQALFPGIYEGQYRPNSGEIAKRQHGSAVSYGYLLGQAVVFSQANQGFINIASPSTRAFLNERCEGLSETIPDYTSGEW